MRVQKKICISSPSRASATKACNITIYFRQSAESGQKTSDWDFCLFSFHHLLSFPRTHRIKTFFSWKTKNCITSKRNMIQSVFAAIIFMFFFWSSARKNCFMQVSWLGTQMPFSTFPKTSAQAVLSVVSETGLSVTVAGPRRIYTCFPLSSRSARKLSARGEHETK